MSQNGITLLLSNQESAAVALAIATATFDGLIPVEEGLGLVRRIQDSHRIMNMNDEQIINSLGRRMQVIAQFIQTRHPSEFRTYWSEHWTGKATSDETIAFFAGDEFVDHLFIGRRIL